MADRERIAYSEADDRFDAVIARPEGAGPHPAVLVCHAWGGRDAFAEGKAQALADLGYLGAAIDVYGLGQRGTDAESSRALMTPLIEDPERLGRRLHAAFEAVRQLPGVDGSRMGVIGFCFGGLCAIRMARMGLPLRGAVSFHGLLKVGKPLHRPVSARILVLHGQDDPMVPPADIGAFAAAMHAAHADWTLHAYAGVMHAFTNPAANDPDFGTVYDAEADRRSHDAMRKFLAEVLA